MQDYNFSKAKMEIKLTSVGAKYVIDYKFMLVAWLPGHGCPGWLYIYLFARTSGLLNNHCFHINLIRGLLEGYSDSCKLAFLNLNTKITVFKQQ